MQLASLRKHWLLILLIVIGLLWWPAYYRLFPSTPKLDWGYSLTNIDYESLVVESKPEPFWQLVVPVGFIVVSILAFIRMWRVSNIVVRFVLMLASPLLCTYLTCGSWVDDLQSGWDFRHVMNIQYQSKEYQLAFATYTKPFDIVTYQYSVFECDLSGKTCSQLKDIYLVTNDIRNDHLVVSDNRLILDRGFEQIPILPAKN